MIFDVEKCFTKDAQKYIDIMDQCGLSYEFLEVFLMLDREAVEGLYQVGEIKALPKDLWHGKEPKFCIDDIENYLYSEEILIMGVMFRVEENGGRKKWAERLQLILDKIAAAAVRRRELSNL